MQSDVMVKISSQSSSSNTAKPTADSHIKTEPCPAQEPLSTVDPDKHLGAPDFGPDLTSSPELVQIKQEPDHCEADFMQTGSRNVQLQSTDPSVSTKTEPDCVPVNVSFSLKAETEVHDVVNGEVYFPVKEEEEDVTKVKLEAAEEESDLGQDEEAGAGKKRILLLFFFVFAQERIAERIQTRCGHS